MANDIRPHDLTAKPPLSDKAVEQLARSITASVADAADALTGATRSECSIVLADVLTPASRDDVLDPDRMQMIVTVSNSDGAEEIVGLLSIAASSAVGMADLFLGGPGHGVERPTTAIERHAIAQVSTPIVAPLARAATFRETGTVALHEVDDAHAALIPAQLVTLAATWNIDDTSIEVDLHVVDPDQSAGSQEISVARAALENNVSTLPIDLTIDLAATSMHASEIHALAPGDVVVFDTPATGEAVATHRGRTMLEGRIAEIGDRRQFEVTTTRV
ncbi:MAG: FliM/FliN family flagellar motor C-terminal domain-containing protein [Acidimicrobiales bacterium]